MPKGPSRQKPRETRTSGRRAYQILDLPDELTAQLEAGLHELRSGVAEDGDTIIGQAA